MEHWQNTFFVFPKKSLNPSIALSHSLSTYLSITQNMFTYANPTKKKTNQHFYTQLDRLCAHTILLLAHTLFYINSSLRMFRTRLLYLSLSPSLSLSLSLFLVHSIFITLHSLIQSPIPIPPLFPSKKKVLFKQVLTHLCPHLVRLATHK